MQPVGGRSLSWDGHLVLVHDSESQRRAGVSAWVRRGLDLGAKIVYIEPRDVATERSLVRVLQDDGVDADEVLERGQLEVFRAGDDRFYRETWFTKVLEDALAEGYPTVRWSAEADTAWSVMSPEVHASVEAMTDLMCRSQPVSVLCQYSSRLGEATLQTVCALHADGLRGALVQTTPLPDGCAVAGEVDRSDARMLHLALAAASAEPREDDSAFVVDLGALDFLDVAGARALVTGTETHRARGGTVCLRSAQPNVAHLLRLLGVDRLDGFSLEGSS
ncbi:MAG TPA: MEDS domain-containing protein [Pedococcus sp.]|uniref:MEDS domain-containing protein n=1 Tax=Pedococcus sp. TaxID=2860345 RepID=UPI002F9476B5